MWLDQLCGKYGPAAVFQPGRAGLPLRNGQSDREGNGFREKIHPDPDPVFCFHPVCRYLFHYHLFAAGRHLPRMAGKERIRSHIYARFQEK